jgi:flavin reductase (DIM6/NTAB) family NADH-FMN oxidoreductase RutF
MKKVFILLCTIAVFASCNSAPQKQTTSTNEKTNTDMNVKDKSFDELFTKVDSAEIMPTLTKLILEEANTVITAGEASQYNSMMANWQVLGNYFMQPIPTTMCLLGAGRYTLEFIRKEQSYTMSFFPDEYKDEAMKFGFRSGRNSDKMKETTLTHVLTPSGNPTYKEANVVIESRLFEITTVNPNDFYTKDGKKFVVDGAKDNNGDYHKLVLGRITNVWVRK